MSNSKGFRRNIGCDSRRRRRRAWGHGRAHRVEVERGRDARRRPRERISAFDRSVMRLADVSRAILVPPACRRRDAPAAGYSGRIDPGRVVLFEEYSSAARTTHPPPSGRDDQALEALSAVYVPRWRIGFLVLSAAHSADRAALISEFTEKIKLKEPGFCISMLNEIHRSTKLLARRSKLDLSCRRKGRNGNTFSSCG